MMFSDFLIELAAPVGIKWLYHATSADRILPIFHEGLKPSGNPNWGGDLGATSMGRVYVSDTLDGAEYYGESGPWKGRPDGEFRPVLRFLCNVGRFQQNLESPGDYYAETVVKRPMDVFVQPGDGQPGQWRKLTEEVAMAISEGEWDDVMDDDSDDLAQKGQ